MQNRQYPFDLVYKLNDIIRYSNVPKLYKESVAIHSYHVAVIVIELSTKYKFNLAKALTMALSHDIPETEIDDISHKTKMIIPDVAIALKKAEAVIVSKYPTVLKDAIQEYEIGKSIESMVVQLADADQCSQYSYYEINNLGNNSNEMKNIYSESIARVAILHNKIQSTHYTHSSFYEIQEEKEENEEK
jgi:5'-deoxynucleotidase YfbR-like HD superfamily hydrolase